jgi:hypothetical protein
MLLKILLFAVYMYKSSVSTGSAKQIILVLRILCYTGMDHVENTVLYCSAIIAVEICLFAEPLLSNSCCIIGYFAVVAHQRV